MRVRRFVTLVVVIALSTRSAANADITLGGMKAVEAGRAALVRVPDSNLRLVVSFGSRVFCDRRRVVVSPDGRETPLNANAVIMRRGGLLTAKTAGETAYFPGRSTIGRDISCGVLEPGRPIPPQDVGRRPDVVAPPRPGRRSAGGA